MVAMVGLVVTACRLALDARPLSASESATDSSSNATKNPVAPVVATSPLTTPRSSLSDYEHQTDADRCVKPNAVPLLAMQH